MKNDTKNKTQNDFEIAEITKYSDATAQQWRVELMDVTLGRKPADLVITGGTIVDVNVGKLRKADIAIKGSRIAMVGDISHTIGEYTKQVDATDKFISPGLMDAHMHVESAMVTAHALAEAVLPRGNTTLVAEPHDLADVYGLKGVELLRHESHHLPLRLYIMAPNPVPLSGPELGSTPGVIGPEEVAEFVQWPEVLGLGKIPPAPVFGKNTQQMEKISIAIESGKPLGSRCDYRSGPEIQAMLAAGISDDYTARTAKYMQEYLEAGLKILVSEGSTVPHTRHLAQLILNEEIDTRHCILCTYDRFPDDVRKKGFIDEAIRILIAEGVNPAKAIQMATINTAEHLGLSPDLGSIATGKLADIVILDDLHEFIVQSVYVNGQLVAQNGKVLHMPAPYEYPAWTHHSVKLPCNFSSDSLLYSAPFEEGSVTVRAIGLVDGISAHDGTKQLRVELPVRNGLILPDIPGDVLKLVAIERFGMSGAIGKGFIKGLGFVRGAIAGTIAHDYHCIIAAGANDNDIAFSIQRLAEMGGGFVISAENKVLAELQLPVGGLLSLHNIEMVADETIRLEDAARKLGYKMALPEMLIFALSFLSLPGCPELRISDQGYIGLARKGDPAGPSLLPLIVEESIAK